MKLSKNFKSGRGYLSHNYLHVTPSHTRNERRILATRRFARLRVINLLSPIFTGLQRGAYLWYFPYYRINLKLAQTILSKQGIDGHAMDAHASLSSSLAPAAAPDARVRDAPPATDKPRINCGGTLSLGT